MWPPPCLLHVCSAVALPSDSARYQAAAKWAESRTTRHSQALSGSTRMRNSGLLIRGFGVRVPGGAPVPDLGFLPYLYPRRRPSPAHVCSMFARQHGSSNPGLVRNGPRGAGSRGMRPGSAPPRPADAGPPPVDRWSRPSRQVPGARTESPIPMPSHRARSAGNRHSRGDAPLIPPTRHAGLPARDARGSAEVFPGRWCRRLSRSKQQVRWALSSADGARNTRARMCRAVLTGHVSWQLRPAPGTAYGRVQRGTGSQGSGRLGASGSPR